MNTSFAQLIAPLGCFSTSLGKYCVQHETQGYIHSGTAQQANSLSRLRSIVLEEGKVTANGRAAAEVHVISYPHAPEVRRYRAFSQRVAALMLINSILPGVDHD